MPTKKSTADKLKKTLLYLSVVLFLLSGTLYYYVKGETEAPGFADWADEYFVSGLEVHFIDVGQGDCTLLLCDDTAILIDGGEYEYGRDVVQYLKHHGVEKLDLLIATHRHSDHIGGLQPVLEKMEIEEVLINSTTNSHNADTQTFLDFNRDLQLNGATVTVAESGMIYQFDELVLEVFSAVIETQDENDCSIVLRCDYEETSVLLTGDIGESVEQALLSMDADIDCDLLKVAHHGSRYSSCADFLAVATPDISVVSCGDGNLYGHPDDETLQRLETAGSFVYRTDKRGTIAFSCKDNTIEIISEGKDEYKWKN